MFSQLQGLFGTPSATLLSGPLESFAAANGTSFHLHASSVLFFKQAPPVSREFVKESEAAFRLCNRPLGKGDSKADLRQLRGWVKAVLGGLEGAPLAVEVKAKAGALILANALRFKGLWEREFSEGSTDHPTLLGKKYTKVMMMHRAGVCRHHEDVGNTVQVLETPPCEGKASVVFLMPFHVENLARLDKLLTPELLSRWLEKTEITSLSISLPKVNITSTLGLQVHPTSYLAGSTIEPK